MLSLILSPDASSGRHAVFQNMITDPATHRHILIVPEQQSHQAERLLSHLGGDSISDRAEVLSFSRLASRVFLFAGGSGERELDPGGRILLLYRAVTAISPQLTTLRHCANQPRFLSQLMQTLDELKDACITGETLGELSKNLDGTQGDKLRDLSLILDTFDAMISQVAFDPRMRLVRCAEKLNESKWGNEKKVWIFGFTDFTAQQLEILRLLMRQSAQITVCLTCPDLDTQTDAFAISKHTALLLKSMAKDAAIPVKTSICTPDDAEKPSSLAHLAHALFPAAPQPAISCENRIHVFAAQNARSEVHWAASEILHLVRDKGMRFRDISITARNFGQYEHFIDSIFTRNEIPVFCSQMHDVLDKPVFSIVTGALGAVTSGYAYEAMFQYLKSGLVNIDQDTCDELENYVIRYQIRGSQWSRAKDWTMPPNGYGKAMDDDDHALLLRLNTARKQVIAPLEMLRKNKQTTGAGQASALYAFLEGINLPNTLEGRIATLKSQGNLALADEYAQLWDILCVALEQCHALLETQEIPFDEFALLFRLVLSQYDVGSIPVSLDCVHAGEATRQTGHKPKVQFILGAHDGAMPMLYEETGFLSDDERTLLAQLGFLSSHTKNIHFSRELETIHTMFTCPSEQVYLSYPRRSAAGELCEPSFVLERLKTAFFDLPVVHESSLSPAELLSAPLPTLDAAGQEPIAYAALETLHLFPEQLARLSTADNWNRGSLSQETVSKLYKKRIHMSASRMDLYNSCHFSYFMRYGLAAKPRQVATFAAPEYGTFIHYVLEHLLKDADEFLQPQQTNLPLSKQQLQQLHAKTGKIVAKYVKDELGGLEDKTNRFRYLFSRLKRDVNAIVDNAIEELRASKFRPIAFELGFGTGKDLPPIELKQDNMTISLTGFVDRVDGWVHDGRLHLRIIDYKTGRKTFDLTDVFHGLGLQMLLYLFALKQNGFGADALEINPAGVLYFPARDVITKGTRRMPDAEWKKSVNKELVRSGMITDDKTVIGAMELCDDEDYRFLPIKLGKDGMLTGESLASAERFGKLQMHLEQTLGDICKEIIAGNIQADPYWKGPMDNKCLYCDYVQACHFEDGRGGDCVRRIKTLPKKDFWQAISEKVALTTEESKPQE